MAITTTELTGAAKLVRAILRRDRVRIVVWTLSIAGLVVLTAATVKGLGGAGYPQAIATAADLLEASR